MSTVNVATLKERAEELIAKAIGSEATVIEQNGKRAVLLPCHGFAPDCEVDRETDQLLRARMGSSGREPITADWDAMRQRVRSAQYPSTTPD
jgi:PHD/YefM family antitoxin component YafN of YafNO toxin-antitoxin module